MRNSLISSAFYKDHSHNSVVEIVKVNKLGSGEKVGRCINIKVLSFRNCAGE